MWTSCDVPVISPASAQQDDEKDDDDDDDDDDATACSGDGADRDARQTLPRRPCENTHPSDSSQTRWHHIIVINCHYGDGTDWYS